MSARLLIAGGVTALLLAALVPIGRWEADRAADRDERGMRSVLESVGPSLTERLGAYRLAAFDCLLYWFDGNPFAFELCFDAEGRLIEAIDRRSGEPEAWTVRGNPDASRIRVPVRSLLLAFQKAGVFGDVPLDSRYLPTGFGDQGPTSISPRSPPED